MVSIKIDTKWIYNRSIFRDIDLLTYGHWQPLRTLDVPKVKNMGAFFLKIQVLLIFSRWKPPTTELFGKQELNKHV